MKVHSLHVCVGEGDCAIHLLVDDDKGSEVKAAVLIDGGIKHGEVGPKSHEPTVKIELLDHPLQRTMEWIKKNYTWSDSGELKFNAIVITHWDEDHYSGITQVLRKAVQKTTGPAQIPWLKWGSKGEPETVLYFPAEGLKGSVTEDYTVKTKEKTVAVKYKDEKNKNQSYEFAEFRKALKTDPWPVLGVELFHNKSLDAEHKGALTPSGLIKAHGNLQPGLYCVAVMGNTLPITSSISSRSSDVLPTITGPDQSEKNRSSIATMVMWPGSSSGSPPRVSHYFAGDLDDPNEQAVLDWLKAEKSGTIEKITSVKLNHHGSNTSTPLELFHRFQPDNTFIPTPIDGRYGHPSWPVIFTWHAWAQLQDVSPPPRLITGTFPAAISRETDKGGNSQWVNLDKINAGHFNNKPFQDHLTAASKELNKKRALAKQPDLQSEYELYTKASDGREYLAEHFADIWKLYGFPNADYHWASCGAYKVTDGKVTWKSLLFVRIRSSLASDDGAVDYLNLDSTIPELIPKIKLPEAPKVSDLKPMEHPSLTIRPALGYGTATPAKRPKTEPKTLLWADTGRETDDYLLEHARLQEGSFYIPDETNPNEMFDGGEAEEEEPESPGSWIELGMTPEPPVKETSGWCIYASDLSAEEIRAAGVTNFDRLSFGVLDDFVWDLHCHVLWLEDRPPAEPDVGSITPLRRTDEWCCWFSDVLNSRELAVMNGPQSTVGGFRVQAALAPLGKGPTSTTPAWLHFTTDESVLRMAFGSIDPVLPTGLLKRHCLLVLGLSSVEQLNPVYLHDLLNFIGLEDLQANPLIALLGALPVKPPSTAEELQGKRNAVWFVPSNNYRTTVRLEWPMDQTTLDKLNDFLSLLSVKLGPTSVIARRTSFWSTSGSKCHMLSTGSLVFRTEVTIQEIKLEAIFEFKSSATTLTLTLNTKSNQVLQTLLKWIQDLLPGPEAFNFADLQGQSFGSSSLGEFHFRRIALELVKDQATGKAKLSTFRMDMEAALHHPTTGPTLFLISYIYQKGDGSTVQANLWCSPPTFPQEAEWRLLPDYEKYPALMPVSIDVSQWRKSLDLAALAGFNDAPSFLPTEVLTAEFRANKKGIAFGGVLKPKTPSGEVPTFRIAEVALQVSYEWGSGSSGTFNGAFAIRALLQQPKGSRFGWPTQLIGTIAYSSTDARWALSGTVYDLYASTLAQFFDTDESIQGAVMPILESIRVEYLDITYTYAKQVASSFSIAGILVIGFHRFTLAFNHTGTDWDFTAIADLNQNHDVKSTVGDLVTSLAGSDMNLPDFVANIDVRISRDNKMELVIKKSQPLTGPASMVILLTVTLGKFTFRYIQFREVVAAATTTTKRVLIASMNQLPGSDIPLVGKVGQPYDEVLFMWVQPQKTSPQTNGLTKRQLDTVNDVLTGLRQPPLPYKVVKKGEPTAQDVLLLQGMHFMLMRKETSGTATVALDYAFDRPKGPKTLADEGVEDKGSRLAPYERSEGPLAIKNIGFKYSTGASGKESILAIRLDAYAKIGPVEFALLGLTLGLNFAGASNGEPLTLHNLPTPVVSLEGLQAGVDRPPIEIAGILQYKNTQNEESFAGGLVVSYLPWRFQAAGYYGLIKAPGKQFTTFFVYCVLQGPLITFQFATVEGVCGGFGYNSNLTFPTPQNVREFPLISGGSTTPGPDVGPNQIMEQLLSTRWFFPREGSFWVAAGLTVKAFEILTVQAVLVIQWNPEVEIGIFGLATASIPGGKTTKRFAHVELGITATLSFRTGIMKIEGELTPASFILDPSCHLQGGFALYSWFDSRDDSSVRGDWVFTIGGFHPSYNRPPQYPNPPRLGISWQFGNAISISGLAYFAITPKACMGGGRLDVTLSLNPLFAYLNAFIDFLINFKPFSFIAEGGITVGVRFTLDLWIVCINIKVEIGARLYIAGPPIHGRVHVDFWVFGFDIKFGDGGQDKPKGLSLDEFIEVVCQTHTSGMPSLLGLPDSVGPDLNDPDAHVFAVQEGLIPKDGVQSTPSGEMWVVRAATFEFSVNCKFAIQEATVVTPTSQGDKTDKVAGTGNPIYAKPMYTTSPIKSTLTITITPDTAYALSEFSTEPLWDINQSIRKDVPLALWGKYDRSSDPSYNKNPSALLNGTKEKSVDLMMGVHLSRPRQLPSADKTVPFNVEKFQIQKLAAETPIALPSNPTPAFKPIPSTGDKKQWEDVQKVWNKGEEAAKQTVDLWKSLALVKLGWAKEKVESAAGVPLLTGSKPRKIVDNLPKYYLWAPLLSGL
jgi:hypothetical protein